MELTPTELEMLIIKCSKIVIEAARIGITPIKDTISQRQAFDEFREVNVRSWYNEGLLKKVESGPFPNSPKKYSRIELETIKTLKENRKLK